MKILKIFGVVVGIHVFVLILIFANPGCSSANKPAAADTVVRTDDAGGGVHSSSNYGEHSPISAAPTDLPAFDPNAPAAAVRFSPTRPGTPAAATLEAQPVGDVLPTTTYTVGKGDSLWTIAKKNKITVAEIAAANNIKASATVRLGQRLMIPTRSSRASSGASEVAAAKAASAKAAVVEPVATKSNGIQHEVLPGETLGAIARKYQVKVGEIATANNISDPAKIRPGMKLIIPGWQEPAKGSKGTATKAATAKPVETTQPVTVPTVVIPAPDQDLDSGLHTKGGEPPVIKVDDK